jgi:ketosteroid isomerase-like protein
MQKRAPAGFSKEHAEQLPIGAQLKDQARIADIAREYHRSAAHRPRSLIPDVCHGPRVRDTANVSTEEPRVRDLVELTRQSIQATSRRDVDAALRFLAPDAIWDFGGLGRFEGLAAIRGFTEDWFGAFDEFAMEADEILDLGSGVTYSVFTVTGRPVDSSGHVQTRYASVAVWAEDSIVRITNYLDIDEARAAAEQLAESRG